MGWGGVQGSGGGLHHFHLLCVHQFVWQSRGDRQRNTAGSEQDYCRADHAALDRSIQTSHSVSCCTLECKHDVTHELPNSFAAHEGVQLLMMDKTRDKCREAAHPACYVQFVGKVLLSHQQQQICLTADAAGRRN